MSDVAIRVENLSKRYRIGGRQEGYKTLRDTLADAAVAPVRRLRRLGQPTPPEEIIWALKDVSFEVKHGEVLGIIGRNGAGKTTLLKVLSRITEPTEGYAEIHGRVGSLLEVGTGFHPELTGRENIYLNGAILGMRRAEIDSRFDEIVGFAEIEKFLDTPVKRYSSGMYVRLAFAVAAHLEPEILLVDEVLAVGDVAFQKKCLGKMEDVATGGRTVLFVSHNMAAISSLSGRCVYLNQGRVKTVGEVEQVISWYLTESSGLAEGNCLAERTDRKGNGHAHFTSFEVLDARTMKGVSPILSGQDIVFKIGYELDPQRGPLNRARVGIQIFSANGAFLTAMSNGVTQQEFTLTPGEGCVYCKMPRCPLMTGTHWVTLVMGGSAGLVDLVEQAASLEVETGDFHGSGVVNAFGRQGMFVDYDWSQALDELT